VEGTGPTTADVVAAIGRWVMLGGITLVLGAVSCRLLLAMVGAPLQPAPDRARRVATWGLGAAIVLLPAALVRLAGQLLSLGDPGQSLAEWSQLLVAVVAHTNWGRIWLAQVALAAAGTVAFARARQGSRVAWTLAGVAALGLAVTPALSGHAIGVDHHRAVVVTADALHVVAAGTWLGTLCVLAGVMLRASGQPRRRAPQEWGAEIAGLVRAFSPVALASAGVIGLTGLVAAWVHLDTVASLWETGYGRTLMVKLGLVGLMLAAGAYNWQRSTPRLTAPGGVYTFTRAVSIELTVGTLILLATAVLTAMPLPMGG
jgi:putative copper export protein